MLRKAAAPGMELAAYNIRNVTVAQLNDPEVRQPLTISDENRPIRLRRLLRDKRTFSAKKQTSDFECLESGVKQTCSHALRDGR